jgi:hypothetical protein
MRYACCRTAARFGLIGQHHPALGYVAPNNQTARLEVDQPVACLAALLDGRLIAGGADGHMHWLEIIT